MIYFKVGEDVKELEDTPQMREAINLDKQIANQAGLKAEEIKQKRINEIISRLWEIDQDCIRALRAIAAKKNKPADDEKVKNLDDEADTLRAELSTLQEAK